MTIWFLEMLSYEQMRPAGPAPLAAQVEKVAPDASLTRFFYREIGAAWSWVDRLSWTDEQWRGWVQQPGYKLWVARSDGALAGYLELVEQADGIVEVASLGLFSQFIGRGLRGHLLTVGVTHAWDAGASRVWLHTCSLDGPHCPPELQSPGFLRLRSDHHEGVYSPVGGSQRVESFYRVPIAGQAGFAAW